MWSHGQRFQDFSKHLRQKELANIYLIKILQLLHAGISTNICSGVGR